MRDGGDLDQLFEDWFGEYSEAEREAIKRRYGTRAEVLEARELIEAKARDMLRHYVAHLLPNGLKAQVVAYSRLAAVRYTEALAKARDELVAEAEALSAEERELDELALVDRPRRLVAAVRAWRQLPLLRRLEFAAVISGTNHDDPSWHEWTDPAKAKARIVRFKRALVHEDEAQTDPLAFLVVKSMLLTGFDAPVEGVIYLDRSIREAELLQTIARVNRTGHGKTAGLLVDYANVAQNLKEALAAYSAEDVAGVMRSLTDELPTLRDRHQRLVNLFSSRGVDFRGPDEPCLQLLAEAKLRAEFNVKLKQFLELLELVLPRPEALPYVRDSRRLSFLYVRARKRYRDGTPDLDKSVGAKVRKLIDDHIVSLGVDPKVPPLSITDPQFAAQVEREVSPRARASEMEHAIRFHIREHLDEDPVHYQKLSARLEELLRAHGESWEQLVLALKDFLPEVHGGRQRDASGLDPRTEAPFFAVLEEERKKHQPVDEQGARWLAELTVRLVALLRTELAVVGFWKNAQRSARVLCGRAGPGALHLRAMTPDEAEKVLADTEVVPCFEAPLADARALVQACLSANVPAQVHREACSKPSCSPKFQVLVRREDAPQVRGLLQQRWLESVRREGLVDLPEALLAPPEEGEPPCPACGTAAPLVSGACSDCGLQLE